MTRYDLTIWPRNFLRLLQAPCWWVVGEKIRNRDLLTEAIKCRCRSESGNENTDDCDFEVRPSRVFKKCRVLMQMSNVWVRQSLGPGDQWSSCLLWKEASSLAWWMSGYWMQSSLNRVGDENQRKILGLCLKVKRRVGDGLKDGSFNCFVWDWSDGHTTSLIVVHAVFLKEAVSKQTTRSCLLVLLCRLLWWGTRSMKESKF